MHRQNISYHPSIHTSYKIIEKYYLLNLYRNYRKEVNFTIGVMKSEFDFTPPSLELLPKNGENEET